MTKFLARVFLGGVLCTVPTTSAWAQAAQQPVRLVAGAPFLGIKHKLSVTFSGGFDLDVIGNIINGVLGRQGDDQLAIRSVVAWPDIYVSVPKRPELTLGFGFAQKDEVVLRLSRANYSADPFDAGNFVDDLGDHALTLEVSPYKEQSWEIGLRHYMVMTPRAKQYINLMYGNRIIEPIQAVFRVADRTEPLGTFRLYDRSTVKTFGLEMGLTIERGHVGVFTQVGARFVRRMKRNDEDLAPWAMEFANNTGVRFYMPLQFGVVFRS